ncbi:15-hydroxyprostaglandin dehydrogenase [NAD(+)]-like isoform X2 [Denticeps clupeoides]|uniref:15-hydroxyprostaglandin dehydrogenase [NAD(+)]-like isoform X2 n=1 Tax=Denticeps clupeoides TaxID=299321 RepID=UPI0010A34155|nr:15-hydroxyprostaglandin dehydrogenase [NAD(+)]-like isoform X2 [Denticeps clupeoides]
MWGAVVCGDRLSLLLRGALVVTRLRMCSSRVYRALKRSPRQQETASVAALRSIRGPAMSLSGKVAVVTGAAQGLGKAFARVLLKNGTKVALLDVDEDAGAATEAALRDEFGSDATLFLRCDVCSDEEMKNAFQKTLQQFGRLDVVCNNAGIINETNWQKMVDVNLNGVVRGTYLALQHMKKENGGQGGVIINVASMAAVDDRQGAGNCGCSG